MTSLPDFFKTCLEAPSRHVFKTSLRHVFETSSRRLQCTNFSSSKTSCKMSPRHLDEAFARGLQNVLKASSHNNFSYSSVSSRRFQDFLWDVLKTFQDLFARRLGKRKIVALKTCCRLLQHVLKLNKCLLECYFRAIGAQ